MIHSIQTSFRNIFRLVSIAHIFGIMFVAAHAQAAAIAPKRLLDSSSSDAAKQITPSHPDLVAITPDKSGMTITVQPGKPGTPGISLKPLAPLFDLSAYGHIETKVTNLSEKPITVAMRVDSHGESNTSSVYLAPGESKTLIDFFGYNGTGPGDKLDTDAINQILVFTNGSKDMVRKFHVEDIQAAGAAGEIVQQDPKTVRAKPQGGVLLGAGAKVDPAAQIIAKSGAKAILAADGKFLQVDFSGGAKDEFVTITSGAGMWNLNEYSAIKVRIKNTGQTPLTLKLRADSRKGSGDIITSAAIRPNMEEEVVIPFQPSTPFKGVVDKEQERLELLKNWDTEPGTGTQFMSHMTTGVSILSDKSAGPKSFRITSIAAFNPPVALPAWLGQKPPVEGEWTKTFEDNFDGNSLDLNKWNYYIQGSFLDRRTHFSKDNFIVKDGTLTLRLTKKHGFHNDEPSSGIETDYATGYADTWGKWTQRYGYFEARMKLPVAKCMWPAFWLMPDRGVNAPANEWGKTEARVSTKEGGMEFDIMEALSIYGAQRYNIAMHWDGYVKYHKQIGSGNIYVEADKDGYITCGLLWTPGSAVFYGNGKELFRWESPRISSVQSYIIFDLVTGGWEKEPIDDAQLPADFAIDYIRVWQRKDLASPEDGVKPNDGSPIHLTPK